MQLDEPLHEREAEPEASLAAVESRVRLREGLEETGQHLGLDPAPRVPHREDRLPPRGVRLHRDGRLPSSRRELRRVLQEVRDDLREAHPITVHPHLGRRREHLQPDLALHEPGALVLGRAMRELVQIEPLALELDLPVRDARDVEQIVDEPRQLPHLPMEDRLRSRRLLAARRGVIEEVQAVADGRERVAQLVREHREELVLLAVAPRGAPPRSRAAPRARLRSVMSMLMPVMRSGLPEPSLNTCHRPASQWTLPSGHTTRHSASVGAPVSKASSTRRTASARSSGWTRFSQAASVLAKPPGGRPYMASSSGVQVFTPVWMSHSKVPTRATSCASLRRSSLARSAPRRSCAR